MKQTLSSVARRSLSPSQRYRLRHLASQARELAARACVWRWEICRFRLHHGSAHDILYVGRKQQRDMAKLLMTGLGSPLSGRVSPAEPSVRRPVVMVSEVPTAGALTVPHYVSAVVPLGRTLEDITARYDSELRRSIRKHRPLYHMRQALSDQDIEMADREFLRPYATARKGLLASQIATDEVFRIARQVGRLDLIVQGDQVIGCHLGCEVVRAGKRYWSTLRFGYCEAVFSDAKRLREVNSITTYMALEWALGQGFDYYDIGLCLARPDDGLLKWKRRRGGEIDSLGNHAHLFVRLPKSGIAHFLWETPLFAVERDKLTLHLGMPEGASEQALASRYHEMVFGGLSKIYLYGATGAGDQLIMALKQRYAGLPSAPAMEIIPCP
ncbi:hypothetical protein [Pseudomonas fulva]|uniref:hypothetical protein n=1 Tax=Pseudomonas fulva TaxID=47880 RepID=UPI0034624299